MSTAAAAAAAGAGSGPAAGAAAAAAPAGFDMRTAVRLLSALESLPRVVPSLGSVVMASAWLSRTGADAEDEQHDEGDEEDDDGEDDDADADGDGSMHGDGGASRKRRRERERPFIRRMREQLEYLQSTVLNCRQQIAWVDATAAPTADQLQHRSMYQQQLLSYERQAAALQSTLQSQLSTHLDAQAEQLHALLHAECLDALNAPELIAAPAAAVLDVRPNPWPVMRFGLTDDQYQAAVEQAAKDTETRAQAAATITLQLVTDADVGAAAAAAGSGAEPAAGGAGGAGSAAGSATATASASASSYSGDLRSIPVSTLESLWLGAAVSPFGHVASQETRVDATVRNARELTAPDQLRVGGELCARLAQLWAEHMLPRKVRVEPYKMNLYGPGGHFAPHRDTPAPGLVGTILVGLADTADADSGLRVWTAAAKAVQGAEVDLTVAGGAADAEAGAAAGAGVGVGGASAAGAAATSAGAGGGGGSDADGDGLSVVWRSRPGSVCMFYPDVTHAVLPVRQGVRATIALKVFAAADEPAAAAQLAPQSGFAAAVPPTVTGPSATVERNTRGQLLERAVGALRACPTPFGLLLHHYYTQEAEQLRGSDAKLWSLLCGLGDDYELTQLAVLVAVEESGPEDEGAENDEFMRLSARAAQLADTNCNDLFAVRGVFPACEAAVQYAMAGGTGGGPPPAIGGVRWGESLPFFALSALMTAQKRVTHTLRSHGGHGGNEANPSSAESIYLHRAVIVRRINKDEQTQQQAQQQQAPASAASTRADVDSGECEQDEQGEGEDEDGGEVDEMDDE